MPPFFLLAILALILAAHRPRPVSIDFVPADEPLLSDLEGE